MRGVTETSERLTGSPVVRAWLVSRGIVLAALLAALLVPQRQHASLLAWDAAWYRAIAANGYAGAPEGAVRFFPAWPELVRALSFVTAAPPGVVLVVLANAAAVLYFVLARKVALTINLGPAVADRVPVVVALAPAGFVLVMGYAEALFGVLLCLVLLYARRGQWLLCAAAGLAAGAMRPTGVLLCLPIAIECWRLLRPATPTGIASRLTAVGAPAAGLGLYLAWTWVTYGDALAPFRAQTAAELRGGVLVSPLRTLATVLNLLSHGQVRSVVLHLVWVMVALALLVVSARRLPASFTVFAAATLFLAITATNFGSFERYASSALPLLFAAAIVLTEHPRMRRFATIAAPLLLFGHSLLAFIGGYVP
jgi:hypothetical protein